MAGAYILEALVPVDGYRPGALITDPGTIALLETDPAWPASFRRVLVAAIAGAGGAASGTAAAPVTVPLQPPVSGPITTTPAAPPQSPAPPLGTVQSPAPPISTAPPTASTPPPTTTTPPSSTPTMPTPAPAVSALSAALLQVPALLAAEAANAAAIAALTSGLPHGAGTAPTGPTTIVQPGAYQELFAAGSIHHGCYIQNPPVNRSWLYVDTTGATGTTLLSTSQQIAPGQVWSIGFLPSNAVTVLSPDPISFIAGTY